MRMMLNLPDRLAEKLNRTIMDLQELDCADEQEIISHIIAEGIAAVDSDPGED